MNPITSFGYFDDPAGHVHVLWNIATALKADGRLVLDYLNVAHADANLRPDETTERNGVEYRISRWSDAQFFFKRIAIHDRRAPAPLQYVERVARLALEDFRFMLALCDMHIDAIYGDYALSPFDAQTSPRLILVASRNRHPFEPGYLRESFFRMRLRVSGEMPRYDASIDC
jgi:hypothetical protein